MTLEGLILSGREALAADGKGDVSEESEIEEEDSRGFHQYRAESVRAALMAPGHIPDAALIHAARKTRQQVWEVRDSTRPSPTLILYFLLVFVFYCSFDAVFGRGRYQPTLDYYKILK